MRKDRVSCKADGTHLFPLLYAITGTLTLLNVFNKAEYLAGEYP